MSETPDNRPLLDDVLRETMPDDFRSAMLGETLRLARRRRIVRRTRSASLACAAIVTLGIFSWRYVHLSPREFAVTTVASAPNCEIVRTEPLPPAALVSTASLPPLAVTTTTTSDAIAIVHTLRDGGVRLINDDELLALAAPHHPALVRIGPQSQELIFLDLPEPRN